jgi:hypothetical protein
MSKILLKKSRIDDDFADNESDYIEDSIKDDDDWDIQEGVFEKFKSPTADESTIVEEHPSKHFKMTPI